MEPIIKCRYLQLCNTVHHTTTINMHVESTSLSTKNVHKHARTHTGARASRFQSHCDYQLSESTSLLLSSVFSVGDLVDLFHFCEFSDSSDEDLFCRLHFARLFLNQTYA